jgi:hypothetical protein
VKAVLERGLAAQLKTVSTEIGQMRLEVTSDRD